MCRGIEPTSQRVVFDRWCRLLKEKEYEVSGGLM